jgi:hypothetical protein
MSNPNLKVLGWVVLLTLTLGIARQLSEQRGIYLLSDVWGKQFAWAGWDKGVAESFENQSKEVKGRIDVPGLLSPAEASLNVPREPYNLLNDVLAEKTTEGSLTAKTCYQTDFLAQSNKVGNYIQRTNNFKHATPDSCSAPRTELVDSFYRNS